MSATEPQYPDDVFEAALKEILAETGYVSTRMLADHVGCSREPARRFLTRCHEANRLSKRQVGGSVNIYAPTNLGNAAVRVLEDTDTDGDAPAQTDTTAGDAPAQNERLSFFPSRREIVVNEPTDHTRTVLARSSHLVDQTEDSYLYKVSKEDVWNTPYESFDALRDDLRDLVGEAWSPGFESRLRDDWDRAHQYTLRTGEDGHSWLHARDADAYWELKQRLTHNDHYTSVDDDKHRLRVKRGGEATVKEFLYDEDYPVIDERRLDAGADLDIALGADLELRDYQQEWVDHFAERKAGVFVGPSGSGKTVAAIGAMAAIGGETLILVPNRELAQQWEDELYAKTTLSANSDIGQYHGGEKRIRPVTIATYDTAAMTRHRTLFNDQEWGLVIADECHHAVAETWKRFHTIQSTARLGLSATPVRESGDAKEIYTLIGPPVGTDWGQLFTQGWVAKPDVELITVPWGSERERRRYEQAEGTDRLIIPAANSKKTEVVRTLLDRHRDEQVIVFVDWLKQGEQLADALDLPFISGEMNHDRRDELYQAFRDGDREALVISRVGDEGIDLPDAEVAILASTMGSSRSQTGQRSGRTMRPSGGSQVYVLLTKGTGEEDWGRESTGFLAEKGIDIEKSSWE